jgi:hypothetical protein
VLRIKLFLKYSVYRLIPNFCVPYIIFSCLGKKAFLGFFVPQQEFEFKTPFLAKQSLLQCESLCQSYFFAKSFYEIGLTDCLQWLASNCDPSDISVSWPVRITGVSHQCLTRKAFLNTYTMLSLVIGNCMITS